MARDDQNADLELDTEHEAPAAEPELELEPADPADPPVEHVAFRLVDSIRNDDETDLPLPLQSIETAVSARHELLRLERGSTYLTSDRDEIGVLDGHPAVERVEN